MSNHLVSKHDLKSSTLNPEDPEFCVTEFLCFNCDTERRKQGFPSALALVEHLKFKHEPSEKQNILKTMQRRYKSNTYDFLTDPTENPENSKEVSFLPPPQKLITGIKNTSGQVSINGMVKVKWVN